MLSFIKTKQLTANNVASWFKTIRTIMMTNEMDGARQLTGVNTQFQFQQPRVEIQERGSVHVHNLI
jgi:hypothetical protein